MKREELMRFGSFNFQNVNFSNENQDPNMQSILECSFVPDAMQLLKLSGKKARRKFWLRFIFFYKQNLRYYNQTNMQSNMQM
jgi:hypothetical protein